jgi:hypothetical protein
MSRIVAIAVLVTASAIELARSDACTDPVHFSGVGVGCSCGCVGFFSPPPFAPSLDSCFPLKGACLSRCQKCDHRSWQRHSHFPALHALGRGSLWSQLVVHRPTEVGPPTGHELARLLTPRPHSRLRGGSQPHDGRCQGPRLVRNHALGHSSTRRILRLER